MVVGNDSFKGFPMPGASDPGLRFAIFAYPYDAPAGTTLRLKARDEASNEVLANFHVKVFPKTFRTRHAARGRRVPQQGGAGDHEPEPRPCRTRATS